MLGITRIFDGDKLYTISPDDEEVTISSQNPEDETTITPNKMLYFYEEDIILKWEVLDTLVIQTSEKNTICQVDSNGF